MKAESYPLPAHLPGEANAAFIFVQAKKNVPPRLCVVLAGVLVVVPATRT